MAVGRISGPLLQQNLFRDNVPLAFYNTSSQTENPVLYLDVSSGNVGMQTASPAYTLDVAGTINAQALRVIQTTTGTGVATIGKLFISSNTISSTVGPVIVQPTGLNPTILNSTVQIARVASISAGIESTSTISGSVLVTGGQGITGNLYVGGLGSFNTLTARTEILNGGINAVDTGTGDLVVAGGVGIGLDLRVGGTIYGRISTSSIADLYLTATTIHVVSDEVAGTYYPIFGSTSSGYTYPDTDVNLSYQTGSGLLTSRLVYINSSTNSSSTTSGALIVGGGAGVGGNLYVGRLGSFNTLTVATTASTVNLSAANILATTIRATNIVASSETLTNIVVTNSAVFNKITATTVAVTGLQDSTDSSTGAFTVQGGVGIGGNLNVGGNIHAIGNITAEGNIQLGNNTGTDTLTVGAEIASDLIPTEDNKYNIGSQANTWAEGYVNNIYSNILASQSGNVTINPANNLLDINASIRVSGDKPYGTAPVVTNVLYVTMDGSDTNDGRAQDASRACRTIGAALRSPYYGPGTSIKVAPGHYFEDNPLLLQPYTSIIGSDLRTTSIEPINKTQDLFHVQSGCYLAQMQFLNGRSGVLPGAYGKGYNRGAYATAFPPNGDANGNPIDVYHSPYIQNCTNQSGPWLYDGTLFVPNQTVQIPLSVATATWATSSTSITVTVSTGTILQGMSINGGHQDPGYFNARTLLLANKPFIQEQIIAYVNQTYPTFEYNQALCFRDVGIIVENLAYDATFGGNQNSIEAGLAYWDGVISVIAGQETETSAAINYVNTLAQLVITNTPASNLLGSSSTYAQVINTALTGGSIAGDSISSNAATIVTIINNGPSSAPTEYYSSGPDSSFLSAEILLQANRAFIQADTQAYIENTFPDYFYNSDNCYRDVGLITDAIAQDLLFNGVSQTTFAAIQYWNQSGYVGAVAHEITTTTAAINYVSSLAQKIVRNNITGTRYQSGVTQVTTLPAATAVEANVIAADFSVITNIFTNGPAGATDAIVPNKLTASSTATVTYAYNLLQANKEYLKAEAVAYADYLFGGTGFSYSETKSSRDIGLIVDSVKLDILFPTTYDSQTTFAGLQYWNQNGYTGLIASELTTTTNTITYLRDVAQQIVLNRNNGTRYQSTITQVSGTPATIVESNIIYAEFNTITGILTNGTSGVTDQIVANGITSSTNINVVNAYNLLQANIAYLQAEAIAYITATASPGFTYNQTTCIRDVGYMINSICFDLLYGGNRQAVQSGVYYYNFNGSSTVLPTEFAVCLDAINHIKTISQQIIQNQTVTAYQTKITQDKSLSASSAAEATIIAQKFTVVTNIMSSGPGIVSNKTPISLTKSVNADAIKAAAILEANKDFIQAEVNAYINYKIPFNAVTCARDVGYMVDSVSFDLLYGGNRQAIQSGVYYYSYSNTSTVITNEYLAIQASYNHIKYILNDIIQGQPLETVYQTAVSQVTNLSTGGTSEVAVAQELVDVITGIITSGPTNVIKTPIGLTRSTDSNVINAAAMINANRAFIQAEIIAYVDTKFNPFANNHDKSYRDIGLVVDAVSQDIILGGNTKTLEVAFSFWPNGIAVLADSVVTCTMALSHARDISLNIIKNTTVTPQAGNTSTQVINSYFSRGIVASQSVRRNFDIITNVILNGTAVAPPVFQGAAVFAPTGISGDDVKIAPKVLTVTPVSGNIYNITIDTTTVNSATNASLYFGDTAVFPKQSKDVPDIWQQRRVDGQGSMGGSLVDGAVVSKRSPIQSFVYDAFTQVTQGGRGIHIINSGYAQLVSVFTIFCSTAVEVDDGGIASITNSNANFGDYCLVAKGYGAREFSGTLYNPAYPDFITNGQYYPDGYFPNNGATLVFVPDTANRPHIAQIMEIEPPEGYINNQGLPGFIGGNFNIGVLTTGSINISGVNTESVSAVSKGQTVYVVDQYGHTTSTNIDSYGNWIPYVSTGTIVTDVSYQTITLNKAILSGGGDAGNANYFNIYTCGNSYFTVLSSTVYDNPIGVGKSIIPGIAGQEVIALNFINTLTQKIISNITATAYSTLTQAIIPSVTGGSAAASFINSEFNIISTIVNQGVNYAPTITTSGTIPSGAGSAVNLIEANVEFITQETISYINSLHPAVEYDRIVCARDIGLIVDALAQDLLFGGSSQSTFAAIQYWSHPGLTGNIPSEITTTTAAINYLSSLAQKVVQNITSGVRYQSTVTQVTSSPGATASEASTIAADFSVITGILTNGTEGITDQIIPNSLTSSTVATVQKAFTLLQANKSYFVAEVNAYIRATAGPTFIFDQSICNRDVGFIVDSVSFDLVYGGNRQAIQSGVYYYSFSDSSRTINSSEVPQTTAAYEYLKQLVPYIIKGVTTATTYQYSVEQVIPASVGTNSEADTVQTDVTNITNIITNGPTVAPSKTSIGLTASTNPNVINAANALIENIPFLKAELIAYIDSYYDLGNLQTKCARDVRLILRQIIYDLQTGGNYNAVYSGLSYWSRNGTYHLVNLEESVTNPKLFPDGSIVNFYQRSYISASGYLFEYVGAGTNYGALPQVGTADPVQSQEVIMLNGGKVFFTSTDQNGDFRIGPGLVISQATGVLSGRTFTKSLFANLTPFILAIEAG